MKGFFKTMKSTEEFESENSGTEDNAENEILKQSEETQQNTKSDNTDFDILKQSFPEIQSVDDIPKEAESISKKENIPIFDAYLRYLFFQNKRIEEEQTSL